MPTASASLGTAAAIVIFLGGAIAALTIAPKPWHPRRQWLLRSATCSGLLVLALFVAGLAYEWERTVAMVWNLEGVEVLQLLQSAGSMGVPLFLMMALGLYVRVLTWSRRYEFMRRFIPPPEGRSK
jgi:hypothetical protein